MLRFVFALITMSAVAIMSISVAVVTGVVLVVCLLVAAVVAIVDATRSSQPVLQPKERLALDRRGTDGRFRSAPSGGLAFAF